MRFQTLFEGRWIFVILFTLAVTCAFFSLWLSLVFVAFILYSLAFFRDPNRSDPSDQRAVVAAADGTVADIGEIDEKEFLKARTRRVGIFLPSSTCIPIARRRWKESTRLVRAFRNSFSSISPISATVPSAAATCRALIGRIGAVWITKESEGIENKRDENK